MRPTTGKTDIALDFILVSETTDGFWTKLMQWIRLNCPIMVKCDVGYTIYCSQLEYIKYMWIILICMFHNLNNL